MVCNRCISAVENIFRQCGFENVEVTMGAVILQEDKLSDQAKEKLNEALIQEGFEIIDDKKSKMIESVKNLIIEKIHHVKEAETESFSWSQLITEKVHYEYKYLSRLFSSVEGITIEQYIILQKIEKVKELIIYDELTLSEIAWKLNYSSVAHLSNQFKKVTGMTPREFKSMGGSRRTPLDKV